MHRGLIVLGIVLAGAATARAQVIEEVVATVADERIWASELMARMGDRERTRAACRDVLEQMIAERLFAAEARRLGLRASAEDVDRALETIREQNGLDEASFWEAVEAQGLERERYLDELRGQILRLRVLHLLGHDELSVDDAELRRRYEARLAAASGEVLLRGRAIHVLDQGNRAAAERTASRLLEDLRAGRTTFERAMEHHAGGPVGPIAAGELVPEVAAALARIAPGERTGVVRGDGAFHIIELTARDRAGVPPFDAVREELRSEVVTERTAAIEARELARMRREAPVIVQL